MLIKISLRFVPKVWINNIPALVQKISWHRPDDKPLSETIVVSLEMHKCSTPLQRVNAHSYGLKVSQNLTIRNLITKWIDFDKDLFSFPVFQNIQWYSINYIDGLMKEKRNSIANTLELYPSCINPSISLMHVKNLLEMQVGRRVSETCGGWASVSGGLSAHQPQVLWQLAPQGLGHGLGTTTRLEERATAL